MSARLRLVRLLDRTSHRLVMADARAVLDLLAAKFPGVRAAITGGEQS